MRPLVAIVGRPNVGKSTLFNRIAGRRLALVEDVPGVTRDRQYADAEWGGKPFTLIDTGGFVPGEGDPLLKQVREQAQLAIEESQSIVLVVDGRAGLTAADHEVASLLRRSGKPLVLAVNKLDSSAKADEMLADFYALGFPHTVATSAEHALGIDGLLDAMVEPLPKGEPEPEEEPADAPVRIAIIGRPNVGKSTLVNALLGEERVVSSPVPGTTRDPIDSELVVGEQRFVLTDTAGIRRKKSIAQTVEKYSVVAALKALDRSEIAVLLLDASEPAVDQDARLAGLIEDRGRALIVVVNKWDLVPEAKRDEQTFRDELKHEMRFIAFAPMLFVSALQGKRVKKVLELAKELHQQFHFRAPTPQLNKWLAHVVDAHPAPIVGGKPLRLYYIAQVGSAPPAFALTCNRPQDVPDHYKRYLVNQLREAFGLKVPVWVRFKERPGQAKRQARKRPRS
jgi:GTP-binding protein